jgi:hypothetical protein
LRRLRKLVVDGLKGFPEAIEAVFPQAAVQTCIVHLIRNSLDFVSWKDRKPVVAELRKIYRAADAGPGVITTIYVQFTCIMDRLQLKGLLDYNLDNVAPSYERLLNCFRKKIDNREGRACPCER